ncbi:MULTISPECIES: DUF1194 domain-containing protein [unclassified Mesorhizobium]|uniref:DUF1194 domain-containing protein n=1 Tax=unclassified Mesorhizobium TaxID=325217 RepID=UPI000FD54F86|nr:MULTISPECIES: DUF1194 domain-containing protein [unclassified Mesorhizobium]RUV32592.1 DUF1194 domain-containing protein [Mesorhizobium sp. M5C.F.Ca.IN.020.32.2.1]RWG48014.1 MAG: DUF1194 domain-containing protein [Mesorhizobium sp.]RWH44172.1 MAG: DUF1194 domain-containing protein [Mesorhizobium sp.]RWH55997.1 MAG: DUF1194 domain-containing protein [Mesorhizobium sp.]RWI74693.1 MAG: DUF1194 domain-containing protein [Mesorhizobium sp.]
MRHVLSLCFYACRYPKTASHFWATSISLLACLACAQAAPLAAPANTIAVDVELVLAVDISHSMDEREFALQRAGYVEALRHPDFIDAVRSGVTGRIALAYFEWAGTVRDDAVIAWQVIDNAESADAFADKIEARPFRSFRGTSISGALGFGAKLLDGGAFEATRSVIDISGDGPNNTGMPVTTTRDAAVAKGIVINGLPILISPSPSFSHLDQYYAECVTGGPGAFVLPVYAASEFVTAIRRKLILEVSGVAGPWADRVPIRVDAATPVDCLQGERDRRFFSDPYFPELNR